MSTQKEYLERQKAQLLEEASKIQQKSLRLQHRFSLIQKEVKAIEVDLAGLSTQTKKREELEIVKLRLEINSSNKKTES